MPETLPVPVVLAVSTFKNDDAILRILAPLFASGHPFARVIVVDSLGTGQLPARLAAEGWDVDYRCYDRNLGSAGNLAERLRLAAEVPGARYVFALNHDGHVDLEMVARMVRCAEATQNVGAVYPLRKLSGAGGGYDYSASALPLPHRPKPRPAPGSVVKVRWNSSNAALYATAPIRAGLLPWADLWMGWEDLGYGWLLDEHGWVQVVCADAEFVDDYEYVGKAVGPIQLNVTQKPAWYAYYGARNMILIARRTRPSPLVPMAVAGRVAMELAVTGAFRADKRKRYGLIARGVFDGLRGRGGKWKLP